MSTFIWIAGLLAALPTVVAAIAGLIVKWKAIKALHSLAELETRNGTAEARTRRAIAFGRMITRVATEPRTDVGRGAARIRPARRKEADARPQDPEQPTSPV